MAAIPPKMPKYGKFPATGSFFLERALRLRLAHLQAEREGLLDPFRSWAHSYALDAPVNWPDDVHLDTDFHDG